MSATRLSTRDPFSSASIFTAVRLRRVLGATGLTALALAAVVGLMGVATRSTEAIFLAGMYGITGAVMTISSSFGSYRR